MSDAPLIWRHEQSWPVGLASRSEADKILRRQCPRLTPQRLKGLVTPQMVSAEAWECGRSPSGADISRSGCSLSQVRYSGPCRLVQYSKESDGLVHLSDVDEGLVAPAGLESASTARSHSPEDASAERQKRSAEPRKVSAGELVALYHGSFHRFVRMAEAITGEREDALDAVQDGFADALRHLNRYEGRGSFEGWVWRCVMNQARMTRRRSGRESASDSRGDASRADAASPMGELLPQVARLPERQRLVLFLRYVADLSYDEIADVLAISAGTVAATLHTAHRTLRRQLEEEAK